MEMRRRLFGPVDIQGMDQTQLNISSAKDLCRAHCLVRRPRPFQHPIQREFAGYLLRDHDAALFLVLGLK